ncbi:hypothetical protein SDC9_99126 [bioreactor metagenome]|uniref:Uncharacterized protein n=1 Tax=bioreactor metagenome TaxID=1076179 RepID=A0A645AH78_9ZZZZ
MDGFVFQVGFCHVIHPVPEFGIEEIMRNHRIEEFSFYANAVMAKGEDIVFEVLSNFFDPVIFEKRPENIYLLLRFFPVFGNGHVKRFALSVCKR